MCTDGNNAEHAQFFINAQLTALWNIANECAQHYSVSDKHSLRPSGYDYALAEYYAPASLMTPAPKVNQRLLTNSSKGPGLLPRTNPVFFATFSEPMIEFVCAHELVYHLHVCSTSISGFKPTRVSFRVPYVEFNLKGGTAAIGNGAHDIRSVILDFARTCLLVSVPCRQFSNSLLSVEAHTVDCDIGMEILGQMNFELHLKNYLLFLTKAGHHVIYSLPDWDDDGLKREIDFSISANAHSLAKHIDTYSSIEFDQINRYLLDTWRKVHDQLYEDFEMVFDGKRQKSAISREVKSLLEYQSEKLVDDIAFHAHFGAITVAPLCAKEVVVFINIDEILFGDHLDFTG